MYLALINTTKRVMAATPRGLAITNRMGEVVAIVIPDADGFTHQHADEVRLLVQEGIVRAGLAA